MATSDEAEDNPALREIRDKRFRFGSRKLEPRALVEVSEMPSLRGNRTVEIVFSNRVEDGRIAIDPDRVVVFSDRLRVRRIRPGAPHSLRVIEDISNSEDAVGVRATPQVFEGRSQFAGHSKGQVVHNSHIGLKDLHGTPDHPGPEGDEFRVRDVQQKAGIVFAVRLLSDGGKGDAVDSLGHEERSCLPGLRNHDDRRLESGAAECLGNRRIATNVAEAHHALRVEGNARSAIRMNGSLRGRLAPGFVVDTSSDRNVTSRDLPRCLDGISVELDVQCQGRLTILELLTAPPGTSLTAIVSLRTNRAFDFANQLEATTLSLLRNTFPIDSLRVLCIH